MTSGSLIIPALRYRDAHAAIDWLCRVFGMERHAVYEGPDNTVAHAELTYGGGMLMLGSATNRGEQPRQWISLEETGGRETAGLCLIVTDEECVTLYERAKAEGAKITQELKSPEYGGRSFACCDLEGYVWSVGSYNPWKQPETGS